jgi:hypothetical protein
VTEHLSRERLRDIPSLIHGFVSAVSEAFSSDESVHRFLFSRSIGDPVLSQIGWRGRRRIFAYYREVVLPLLPQESAQRAELLVRVSFQLLATTMVGKPCTADQTLTNLSWNILGAEISTAEIAYYRQAWIRKQGINGDLSGMCRCSNDPERSR